MVLFAALKCSNFIISLFFTSLTYRIFIVLLSLTRTHTILFNNNFSASKNFIKNYVNRHPGQLIYDINLFDNNFNLFKMFFPNFNTSVKFVICSGIPSGEGPYHMESRPSICNINPLPWFSVVGYFSGGYSQTDCNFNFNINVNVTVDSYMNSSFNFSFSHLLKNLLASRLIKLGSTIKITAQFETLLQCLLSFSLFFFIYLRNKRDMRLPYFLIAFVCLYWLTGPSSPRCTFIKLKAYNQIQFFTLDSIYICDKLVSFPSSLLCKFYTISKFKRINTNLFIVYCLYFQVTLVWVQDLFIIVDHLAQMNVMFLK